MSGHCGALDIFILGATRLVTCATRCVSLAEGWHKPFICLVSSILGMRPASIVYQYSCRSLIFIFRISCLLHRLACMHTFSHLRCCFLDVGMTVKQQAIDFFHIGKLRATIPLSCNKSKPTHGTNKSFEQLHSEQQVGSPSFPDSAL